MTPTDWLQAELQERYAGHFLPHIAAKIGEMRNEPPVPLESIEAEDVRCGW